MASRHDNPAAFWTSRSGVPLFFVQKGVTHDHVLIDHGGWPAARQARHAQSLLAQPKEGLAAGNEVSGAARMQVITGDIDSVADPELRELLQQSLHPWADLRNGQLSTRCVAIAAAEFVGLTFSI